MTANPGELPSGIRNLYQHVDVSLQSLSPEEGVTRYLQSRKRELRERTVEEYRGKLEYFLEYADQHDIDDLNDLDGRDVDGYRLWRRENSSDQVDSLSPKTMRDEMYLFQNFLLYLESIEAVKPGLSAKVQIPELHEGDGVRDAELDHNRVAEILRYLRRYEYATRVHVVWLLHCHTGRRSGGIHGLDLQDVHLDCDEPYIEFRHRPGETTLKNGEAGEELVNLHPRVADIIQDYIDTNRVDTTDDYGRDPLLTTRNGRLSVSTMRKYFYKWTRPCATTGECPHGESVEGCQAAQNADHASKCPSSLSPYPARHGYITQKRREGVAIAVLSDRCDVSEAILKKHYDERTDEERRELRREQLNEADSQTEGYL